VNNLGIEAMNFTISIGKPSSIDAISKNWQKKELQI